MVLILSVCIAYLIGSIPDRALQRKYHSEGQKVYGVLMEVMKGALATLIALILGKWMAASLAAIFAVVGNIYSPFRRGRGKGGAAVLVAIGCLFVLSPLLSLMGIGIFVFILLVTRTFHLSTLIATIVVMILSIFFVQHVFIWVGTICVGILLLFHHQKAGWDQNRLQWRSFFGLKK